MTQEDLQTGQAHGFYPANIKGMVIGGRYN